MYKRPISAMAPNGTNFEYVVTSEKTPALLTPRKLIRTTAQIAPSVKSTAMVRLCRLGEKLHHRTSESDRNNWK